MLPIELAIVDKLRKAGPCCFNDVVTSLPNFSWGQIFVAVHRLSREGQVYLGKGYSTYQISLSSRHTVLSSEAGEIAASDRAEAVIKSARAGEEVVRCQGCNNVASI